MKFFLCVLASATVAFSADPFEEGVRTTEPLTPAEQAKTFSLPAGFKIELVASDPDIYKPMNMAFDARGRLWVTVSREYPFPAPLNQPARDSIKILEDFDGNGRARKITTFADGLNIPIGLYPYKDGVIAWSIPNIWFFRDTDGDGKADRREVLMGPFGWERDTHGNQASFRRGFDGWLYITHGYNNISAVKAKDGSEIRMQSGNTYRIRLDGSRVEQHTYGQVNPFGLTFDPAGNLYSADCHSSPIYELLHGAYYPSFGKPHDGLGFGPAIMEHAHGSTAICGIMFYADDLWPEEYKNNILIGNVMTSRLNRDRLVSKGSSKTAVEQPDFMTTTDPWFRPVDLQLGPDGALYVADFYNRIIGHYEVPLLHPGRDRERARIWKISYTGTPLRSLPNFAAMDAPGLAAELRSPNMPRRMLAMNEYVDRIGVSGVEELKAILKRENVSGAPIVHALWGLQRLAALDADTLRRFAGHQERDVRVHVMRILAEDANLGALRRSVAVQALRDSDGLVQRAAAESISRNPEKQVYVRPLMDLLETVPAGDVQLRHMVRMALRDQLKNDPAALSYALYPKAEASLIADLCLAIPNESAAKFLFEHIQANPPSPEKTAEYVRHASRYISGAEADKLAAYVRANFDDVDQQLVFFRAIQEGAAQKGGQLGEATRAWGVELADRLLKSADAELPPWWNIPLPDARVTTNPWFLQQRTSADGDENSWFLSSLTPGGEHFTGTLRSRDFVIPAKLSFYLAGHDGVPSAPLQEKNLVRLIAAENGKVLTQTAPPRNDTAQRIAWDLSAHAGKRGHLELVDADTGTAYAWIAAGRFEPEIVPLPKLSPNQISARVRSAADIAKTLKVGSLAPQMNRLIGARSIDDEAQAAVAGAIIALEPNRERLMLAPLIEDAALPGEVRRALVSAVPADRNGTALDVLAGVMQSSPSRVQLRLAQDLSGSAAGTEALVELAEKGFASPRLFLDKTIETKMKAGSNAALLERLGKLTANLEPASETMQKQIEKVRASYEPGRASASDGAKAFAQNCAICHQIDGTGAVVGPQLDGIGGRGLERVLEDILDPNRNVDVNFRSQTVVLKEGDVVTGVLRREEGELIILVDSTGKELSIPKAEIASRRESETSIMPSNFADVISESDFRNLLAFLLTKRAPSGGN